MVSATASHHRRDPLSGRVMPKMVRINCPQARFEMTVNLGNVEINTLEGNRPELWTMPQYKDATLVDLGDPNVRFMPTSVSAAPSGVSRPARCQMRR